MTSLFVHGNLSIKILKTWVTFVLNLMNLEFGPKPMVLFAEFDR